MPSVTRKEPNVLGGAWSLRWSRSPAWRRIEKAHLEGEGYLLPGTSSRKDSPNCVPSTLETGTELGLGRRQRAQTGLPIHGPRVQAASDFLRNQFSVLSSCCPWEAGLEESFAFSNEGPYVADVRNEHGLRNISHQPQPCAVLATPLLCLLDLRT